MSVPYTGIVFAKSYTSSFSVAEPSTFLRFVTIFLPISYKTVTVATPFPIAVYSPVSASTESTASLSLEKINPSFIVAGTALLIIPVGTIVPLSPLTITFGTSKEIAASSLSSPPFSVRFPNIALPPFDAYTT